MQRISIEQYIADRLDGQYQYYSKAATKAKKSYQTIKVIEIILAAFVPFLSALMTPSSSEYMRIVVGLLGVGITILSGALLLYKFNENWVTFRTTAQALKSEKYLFLTRSGPYKGKGATSIFIEKIEAILGEESQKWQSYVISRDDTEASEANAAFAAENATLANSNSTTAVAPATTVAPPVSEATNTDVPPATEGMGSDLPPVTGA